MKKLLLITIAILMFGCGLSNMEKATDLNYEAASLYNQATAAENWTNCRSLGKGICYMANI